MVAARIDVGQNVDVGAQNAERLAELAGVVAHAALHDRVFAGDKKNRIKNLLISDNPDWINSE